MRLDEKELKVIRKAAKQHFGSRLKIWLFGSRVDDSKRGGDIDLFIETDNPIKNKVLKICEMSAEIQLNLGVQKIDILVCDPNSEYKEIYSKAKKTGIQL